MLDQNRYWFPAKKYGIGWGLPVTWQGWFALGVFCVLVGVGAFAILPNLGVLVFLAYNMILCVVLVVTCWIKGEPPGWRWGDK